MFCPTIELTSLLEIVSLARMKIYKVHTVNETIEITADKFAPSKSGRLLFFVVGKKVVATFVTDNVVAVIEPPES